MARPKKEVNPQTGMFNDTLTVREALAYVRKQCDDLVVALDRLQQIHFKLSEMSGNGDSEMVESFNLDGFIVEPTTFIRVCTSLKITLKI